MPSEWQAAGGDESYPHEAAKHLETKDMQTIKALIRGLRGEAEVRQWYEWEKENQGREWVLTRLETQLGECK